MLWLRIVILSATHVLGRLIANLIRDFFGLKQNMKIKARLDGWLIHINTFGLWYCSLTLPLPSISYVSLGINSSST